MECLAGVEKGAETKELIYYFRVKVTHFENHVKTNSPLVPSKAVIVPPTAFQSP